MTHGDQAWNRVLASAGLPACEPLGAGVEGSVFDLHDGTVAKVWTGRSRQEIEELRTFYDAVAASGVAVATPRIFRIIQTEDVVLTVEARLHGDPVWVADGTSPDLTPTQIDVMTEALAALAGVPGSPALRSLPILPGETRLPADLPFESALADLVDRRAARFAAALRVALPSLDTVADNTSRSLRALPVASPTLVHGDLIAANVLTSRRRASALLDFGFLTTTGDPAFDAAVTASCFDMYGPDARATERTLDRAFTTAFDHETHRLGIYRAAYALITACCFGDNLDEGHFAWCINMLNRPDIREAVD